MGNPLLWINYIVYKHPCSIEKMREAGAILSKPVEEPQSSKETKAKKPKAQTPKEAASSKHKIDVEEFIELDKNTTIDKCWMNVGCAPKIYHLPKSG